MIYVFVRQNVLQAFQTMHCDCNCLIPRCSNALRRAVLGRSGVSQYTYRGYEELLKLNRTSRNFSGSK